jgi:hypothetical protein
MAKSIHLSTDEWNKIRRRIKKEYQIEKPSILLIKSVLKRELGFSVRLHSEWVNDNRRESIYLDFYDDALETMFRLKYL